MAEAGNSVFLQKVITISFCSVNVFHDLEKLQFNLVQRMKTKRQ